jgi:HAE1 family hydrophobic/amphiphilic exporter-1
VGSIVGLWITGNTINIFSLIGLIMAFGLVAKNGILLIDFANTLREQGMERTAALAEAAKVRLRPILMTSATMVFGMLPLAMKAESGGESRAPMAVVVIGAIITSTILAVLVLPAVYVLLDDLQALLARRPALVAAPVGPLGEAMIPAPGAGYSNGRGWGPIRYARQLLASRNGAHAPSQVATGLPEPPA